MPLSSNHSCRILFIHKPVILLVVTSKVITKRPTCGTKPGAYSSPRKPAADRPKGCTTNGASPGASRQAFFTIAAITNLMNQGSSTTSHSPPEYTRSSTQNATTQGAHRPQRRPDNRTSCASYCSIAGHLVLHIVESSFAIDLCHFHQTIHAVSFLFTNQLSYSSSLRR